MTDIRAVVAATLLQVANEIDPGYDVDPEWERPKGWPRVAWQRKIGALQQKRVIAARYRARAERYLLDLVAGDPGVEVKTGCDCSNPNVCPHCLAALRNNEQLVQAALTQPVQGANQ